MSKRRRVMQWMAAVLAAVSCVLALFLISFEIGMYSDFQYYEKEYVKYHVTSDLDMELSDVMQVTHKMMDYLRGDRKDLVVYTTIDGVSHREFFNDQDKAHMADVRNLFIGGLHLRTMSLLLMLICVAGLVFVKSNWKYILPRAFLVGLGVVIGLVVLLGIACAVDFNAVFTRFHEIFFTNDLWLFDPATDYMINMLPEGFFFDMVLRIGSIFGGSLFVLVILSIIGCRRTRQIRL